MILSDALPPAPGFGEALLALTISTIVVVLGYGISKENEEIQGITLAIFLTTFLAVIAYGIVVVIYWVVL